MALVEEVCHRERLGGFKRFVAFALFLSLPVVVNGDVSAQLCLSFKTFQDSSDLSSSL